MVVMTYQHSYTMVFDLPSSLASAQAITQQVVSIGQWLREHAVGNYTTKWIHDGTLERRLQFTFADRADLIHFQLRWG
jgi:hypothetical protein